MTTRPLLWGWLPDHTCMTKTSYPPRFNSSFFFTDVTTFYAAAVRKMVPKFPFKDPILPDSVVLDPSKKTDLNYAPVVRLADRFASHVDTELLKEEWDDFRLLDEAAVSMTMVDAKSKQRKPDQVWSDVVSMNTSLGILRFPEMVKVHAALLCLPHSNTGCKRAFSMVRKTHTKFRTRWNAH